MLGAYVLPELRAGTPRFVTLTIRSFGEPIRDLDEALRQPGVIYKQPPKDLPRDLPALLRRVNEKLKADDQRLLVVVDQFDEFIILHGRDPARQAPLLRLLQDLQHSPLNRVWVLLVMRSDYIDDLPRLNLPTIHDGVNLKWVGPFIEPVAQDFLARSGLNLGPELIATVVRHASDLDETRGKVRPIVLNMLGLTLESRSTQASRVLGRREAERLLFDHVRDGLMDPLARDRAPAVLGEMITPAGTKQPMAVGDLARKTHLEVPLVFGCLARLVPLGFVRRVDPGDDGPAEHQVWEVAHDFLASLLSRILPGWKPSLARRLLPWLGPAVLAAGIGGILVLTALSLAIDPVENWARHFGGIAVRRDDGGYAVQFHDIDRLRGCLAALAPRDAGSVRELEFDFIPREVNAGGLARFSDELSNIDKLSNLSTFTLREKLSDLSPSTLRKVGPVKLPPAFGRLRSLTTLNLTGGACRAHRR